MTQDVTPDTLGDIEKDIINGVRAKQIAEDPVFKSIFDNIKRDVLINLLQATPSSEKAGQYHFLYLAVNRFEKEIEAMIEKGEYEKERIEQMAQEEMREDITERLFVPAPNDL